MTELPPLTQGQIRVVTDGMLPADSGLTAPDIEYQIFELGGMDNHEHSMILSGASPLVPAYDSEALERLGVAGWNAMWHHDGLWHAVHRTPGGGCGTSVRTKAGARAALHREVDASIAFWMEKVVWHLRGDLWRGPHRHLDQPVIRCGGHHYTLGPKPQPGDRGPFGHGGRQFAFRYIHSGVRVQSNNVWSQGRIPREFRELLPDNATPEVSDEQVRMDRLRAEIGRIGGRRDAS
jgi:hypothetical protein